MAKARAIPGLSEEDPYAAVAAKVVATRAAELADNSAGVLDTDDIERVHDMRVATRRLRAALEVFEPCFPRKRFKATLREVKALADALGERRDRDVTIAALSRFAAGIGRPDVRGVESLIAQVRDEQADANVALAAYVSQERLASLLERLDDLVRAAAEQVADADAVPSDGGAPRPIAQPPPPAPAAPAEPSVSVTVNGGSE